MKRFLPLLLGLLLGLGGILWGLGGFQEYCQVSGIVVSGDVTVICSPYSGIMTQVMVQNGQAVHPGEVLFLLDPRPVREQLNGAKRHLETILEEGRTLALLGQMRTRRREALIQLHRLESQQELKLPDLFSPGERERRQIRRNLDDLSEQTGVLEWEVQRGENRRQKLLVEEEIKAWEIQLHRSQVSAPVQGRAEFLMKTGSDGPKPGNYLAQGEPVLQIADPTALLVEVRVPVLYQGRFSLGTEVMVRDLRDPYLRPFRARIRDIEPSDTKGSFAAKAGPVPKEYELGVPMEVRIPLKDRPW